MDRWRRSAASRQRPVVRSGAVPAPPADRPRLLIVEPEPLLQWSLGTYLSRWFEVFVVESAATAQALLDERPADALIVSDELPDHAAEKVETWARLRNCSVAVIRTVTDSTDEPALPANTRQLEKPFDLAQLASFLGVTPEPAGEPTDPAPPAAPTA